MKSIRKTRESKIWILPFSVRYLCTMERCVNGEEKKSRQKRYECKDCANKDKKMASIKRVELEKQIQVFDGVDLKWIPRREKFFFKKAKKEKENVIGKCL